MAQRRTWHSAAPGTAPHLAQRRTWHSAAPLAGRSQNPLPGKRPSPSVVPVAAFNAIFDSGLGRGCTYSLRMRGGLGALTGPGRVPVAL
ncbi:hypothetical protein SUDANB145_01400 [Streptomyces sp. enrichment culture]